MYCGNHHRAVKSTLWAYFLTGFILLIVILCKGCVSSSDPQVTIDQLEMGFYHTVATLNDSYELNLIPPKVWTTKIKPARLAVELAIDRYKIIAKSGSHEDIVQALKAVKSALEAYRGMQPGLTPRPPSTAPVKLDTDFVSVTNAPTSQGSTEIDLVIAALGFLIRILGPGVAKLIKGEKLTDEERLALETALSGELDRAKKNDLDAETKVSSHLTS